uniref:HAUS augmin like complex subunit 7 n=1 Tax=Panthera tigris altaica TaxID=74533 RepID=A0A8C9JGB7_PANTA
TRGIELWARRKDSGRDSAAGRVPAAGVGGACDLNCPVLEGLYITEPKTIQELLCSPSKYRLEILEWMCIRVCPSWQDKFSSLKGAPVEVKIQVGGWILSLCVASLARRSEFPIGLVFTAAWPWGCPSREKEHLEDTREKNEVLLGELFSSPHLQTLLSPECEPWSLDVQPFLRQQSGAWQRLWAEGERRLGAPGAGRASRTPLPLALLCFEQHKQGGAVSGADTSTLDQKLRLVISDFHQLVVAFLQVYDDELGECCQRPGPYLHPCGPIVQAVHQTLTSCNQGRITVTQVADTSAEAVQMVKQQQDERICWGGSNPLTSLGMWSPASRVALSCSTSIWGVAGDCPLLASSSDA